MDLIVRSELETLWAMCAAIGNTDAGAGIGTEKIYKASLYELGKYLMYLASADGSISFAEAEFIGEAIPQFRGWQPAQFKEWILEKNVHSTEFEQTPPTLLPLLVLMDNIISRNDPDSDDSPEMFLNVYRQVGKAFLACDGESFSEKSDFNTYIEMMQDYIDENGTRERRSSYHTIDVDGAAVGMKITIGKPVISYSEEDDDDDIFDDDDDDDSFSDDDDFAIDDGCLNDYEGDAEHVVVPDGVTEIDAMAFMNKESIECVELPEGVTVLGDSAFLACKNLREIDLPESLVEIGDSTFMSCERLTGLDLPEGLVNIGDNAFMFCKGLTEIRIPGTVGHIGEDAFGFCDHLKHVSIPASLMDIGTDAFMFCAALETVSVFGGSKNSDVLTRLKEHFPENVRLVWEEEDEPASGIPHAVSPAHEGNVPILPQEAPAYLMEHVVLVLSGCYTSRRDADFVGQSIRKLMQREGFEQEEAYELMAMPGDIYDYTLHKDALRLAEVFRLQEELFDPYTDTEAMIHRGMFREALAFHALRSLAWTVGRIAKDECRMLRSFSFEELQKIGEVLARHSFNYEEDSCFSGLCGHEDWRVFYVPDAYLESNCVDTVDMRELCGKENRGGNTFFSFGTDPKTIEKMRIVNKIISHNEETLVSLEDLRKDLIDLKPVMETLYNGFMQDRDRSKPLLGFLAYALNAWCALAVAAREPFYSEEASDSPETEAGLDGPMSRPYSTDGASYAAKTPKAPAAPRGDLLDLGGATVIRDCQFVNEAKLRNIIIPEGVTEIGERAFYSCMNLETVVLPGSLKKIGKMAFMSCRALRQVEIPEGVEEICDHAFGATNCLKAVHLPDSLQRVDKFIFGMGGDSPYAVAHMSGALAGRLQSQGDGWSDAISARGYVIDGNGYSSMKSFVKGNPQAAQPKRVAAESNPWLQPEANAQLPANLEAYIEKNPVVVIPGKKFVFTGLGVNKSEQQNHPVVKAVEAAGGLFRTSVSGLTNYVVVGGINPGEAAIRDAVAQQEKGKNVHIILLEALEAALGMNQNAASAGAKRTPPAVNNDAASGTYGQEPADFEREEAERRAAQQREQAQREREEAERRAAQQREQAQREREEAERRAAQQREQAQREREAAERRAEEQRKQALRDQLTAEKNDLLQEMSALKGLFSGLKRKKLQARIDEINEQLRRI